MTDTKTLEGKIRNTARDKHRLAIHASLQPIRSLLCTAGCRNDGNTEIECPDGDRLSSGRHYLQLGQLLQKLEETLMTLTSSDAEERAIDDFLARVDKQPG